MPERTEATADGPEQLIGARTRPEPAPADVAPGRAGRLPMAGRLRAHASLVAVLLAYLASALVVHPLAPVAVSDDWVYARSVEILFAEHTLRILPLTVTTLVFQVFWGSLFVKVFGLSFGVLRLSTVILVVLGAWAFYGLCRQLDVSHRGSALGTAVFLFNPLTYSLSFTYMSDGGFASLMIISLYFFVRGLRPTEVATGWVVAGSAVAALAFLQRQQGALIPAAVVVQLLLAGRLRPLRRGVALVASVVVVPTIAMAAYYYWLFQVHGVPLYQKLFVDHIKEVGTRGAVLQVGRLSFISMMYLGLFVLPLVAGAVPGARRLARSASGLTWAVTGVVLAVVATGAIRFGEGRPRMPYIPDFLNASGIGPVQQIRGQRPALVGRGFLTLLTGLCGLGALAVTLVVFRRMTGRPGAALGMAGLVVSVFVLQAAGTLPSSFSFFNWQVDGLPSPSLDRYLLPLLPLTVVLVLWGLRELPFSLAAAWALTALVGVFAVAGTRDSMVRQEAVWRLADATADSGVVPFHIDGGAAWSGYRLFDYSVTNPIPPPPGDSPWWVFVFAPAVDGTYVVGGRPLPGYDVVRTVGLSSWLEPRPARLYLLKRQGAVPAP